MQIKTVTHPSMQLIGMRTRTNNQNELKPETTKIGPLVGRYMSEQIAERIPNRKRPGVSLSVYSNYESDEYGDFDFLFGEEVTRLDKIPEGFTGVIIPEGQYLHIVSDMGQMPQLAFTTWQKIWELTRNNQLGGQRSYDIDFEVYDQMPDAQGNMSFSIYLGIK